MVGGLQDTRGCGSPEGSDGVERETAEPHLRRVTLTASAPPPTNTNAAAVRKVFRKERRRRGANIKTVLSLCQMIPNPLAP